MSFLETLMGIIIPMQVYGGHHIHSIPVQKTNLKSTLMELEIGHYLTKKF